MKENLMSIKAIETKYKGYRFRSRIEARWAVFFETARIKWDYEPEGFLVDGVAYLPDFYLPDLGCYFEVKGYCNYNINFFKRFSCLSNKPIIIAEGDIPDPDKFNCEDSIGLQFIDPSLSEDHLTDLAWGYRDMFLQCSNCNTIMVMNEAYCTMKDNCSRCRASHARWMPLSHALKAARSARFEFSDKEP